jgi:hypothetical protein
MLRHRIFRKKKGEKETLLTVLLLAYFVIPNVACMSRGTQQKKKNACDSSIPKYE